MVNINILGSYIDKMTDYTYRTKGGDKELIRKKITEYVKNNTHDPKVDVVIKQANGDMQRSETSLLKYIHSIKDNIISPSGSIYRNTDVQESTTSKMVKTKLEQRSAVKKKMLECKKNGDDVGARMYNSVQASIKININSLIGAMGQNTNLFSNPPGFNAVTAFARGLIARAYTSAEQVLGGNFKFDKENEVINHILTLSHSLKSRNLNIVNICNENSMKVVSTEELYTFIYEQMNKYKLPVLTRVSELLKTLTVDEVNYVYYYQNLRHIILHNSKVNDQLKTVVQCRYPTKFIDIADRVKSLRSIDEDIFPITSLMMGDKMKGENGKYGLVWDFLDKNNTVVDEFIIISNSLSDWFGEFSPVLDTFIFTPDDHSMIHSRPDTLRNTTVVSDTDSVIYQVNKWVSSFNGNSTTITQQDYIVAATMTYFLTKTIAHNLEVFSVNAGASEENKNLMRMKNEFTYPAFIYYGAKKTYCALMAVQEGIMFNELVPEIKGVALRSSSICKESRDNTTEMLIETILKASLKGELDPKELIRDVIRLENLIEADILAGNSTYLKIASIKEKSDYAKPESSAWAYWDCWEKVFSDEYGHVQLSKFAKAPIVNIDTTKIDKKYTQFLIENHPKIYASFKLYKDMGNKVPTAIIINPDSRVVPKSLLPIIDMNNIIYHNLSPIYNTLHQLKIHTPFKKKRYLFREIYPALGINE